MGSRIVTFQALAACFGSPWDCRRSSREARRATRRSRATRGAIFLYRHAPEPDPGLRLARTALHVTGSRQGTACKGRASLCGFGSAIETFQGPAG